MDHSHKVFSTFYIYLHSLLGFRNVIMLLHNPNIPFCISDEQQLSPWIKENMPKKSVGIAFPAIALITKNHH